MFAFDMDMYIAPPSNFAELFLKLQLSIVRFPPNINRAPPKPERQSTKSELVILTTPSVNVSPKTSATIAPPFIMEVTLVNVQLSISASNTDFRPIAPAEIRECRLMNLEFLITVLEVPLIAVE